MIRIDFWKSDQGWQGFSARGHAGYADPGDDIVCAAVSVLTQTAILGIQEVVGVNCLVDLEEQEGLMEVLIPQELSEEQRKQVQLILEVLYVGLKATEKEYKRFVRVKEVPYRENESSILRHQKGRRKY
ncbi:MAG TPA: ribosomal-processing cysteine protease Prp [Firmicutes bacterium]|jgi:uncharacterized protein YsxB (DUF464 family)|nr:ribosomal-processing cysteine protease Prp [Bacillota bacterium]HHT43396.1 ribosomal-processing cysteine protease Prp [Bacillota bacterium]